MSHVQWNPFRELSLLRAPGAWPFASGTGLAETGRPGSAWAPAVDVYENDEGALVVSAELPGVDPAEVEVTLEDGVLTIAGERKFDGGEQTRVYRRERAYGSFRRSFTVPSTVDGGAVAAEHKDGTLRITLPQKEEAKPQRITIKAA
ncbi:MAG: Hsp20/alpha crystallin family protein [Acidobacteria bacterium]|nr:Hsp20/alpha crystallin family protein [Acidobacteriota bacterium]